MRRIIAAAPRWRVRGRLTARSHAIRGGVILTALALSAFAAAPPAAPAPRVKLQDVAARCGFPAPRDVDQTVILQNARNTLVFGADSRKLTFDKLLIWLNGPLSKVGTDWTLATCDADIVEALVRPELTVRGMNVSLVMLDPGHGGPDTGALGSQRVSESKLVLDIARRAQKKLSKAGVNVRLTRPKDRAMPLTDRTLSALKAGADLYISIHLNSSASPTACGIEAYVMPAPGFASTSSWASLHAGRPCPSMTWRSKR